MSALAAPLWQETIFCAYALFLVEQVSTFELKGKTVSRIDLRAIDKYDGIDYPDSAYPGGLGSLADGDGGVTFTRWSSETDAPGTEE